MLPLRALLRRTALGIAVAIVVAAPAAATVCGDADGDGRVTDTDAVLAFRRAANLPSTCKELTCDVDGDGVPTDADARAILRKASGQTILERCGIGSVSGRILTSGLPALAEQEREPNDLASTANIVGRVATGDRHTVRGQVDPSSDPFDGFVLLLDTPTTLDLRLRFSRRADVDLMIADPRTGASLTCESTAPGREQCRVEATPGTDTRALHVVVAAAADTPATAYVLTVDAASGTEATRGPALAPGPGAGAARALAPGVYLGLEPDVVPGELIVLPQQAATAARTATETGTRRALAAARVEETWEPRHVTASGATLCIHRDAARLDPHDKDARGALRRETREAVARLADDPSVAWAQPNYVARAARLPNDPLLPSQWHYRALGLEDAWDLSIGADDVIVAVIDTGIRSDHPDIANRLIAGYDFISDRRRANDGDGLDPDPFDPGDLPGSALEGSFHGTHVAGTIGATTNNETGVAGVTWRTRIMPLRVLGVGGGSTFDIGEAIRFAARLENVSGTLPAERAAIINLSLVAFGDDPFMRAAVDAATAEGVLVIAAAGNTASDVPVSPALYENAIAVAASDAVGEPARYSAFGPAVELIAPGGDRTQDLNADGENDGVLSTLQPGSRNYERLQGTSMAAAHVTGVAALMLAVAGPVPPADLRAALSASADDRGPPGRDDRFGAGFVDPVAALRLVADLPPLVDPVLALDSETLAFGPLLDELRLHVRNAGGGVLALEPPVASTTDGLGWLRATLDDDPTLIRMTVDRRRLVPGTYAGSVLVPSNGGMRTVAVTMGVPAQPQVDVGEVTVALIDPRDGSVAASATTSFAVDYTYRLDDVRGGVYELRANTDRDHDGNGCDVGELCGAFPTLAAPSPVTVIGGADASGLDFVLGTVVVSP